MDANELFNRVWGAVCKGSLLKASQSTGIPILDVIKILKDGGLWQAHLETEKEAIKETLRSTMTSGAASAKVQAAKVLSDILASENDNVGNGASMPTSIKFNVLVNKDKDVDVQPE